MHTEPTPEFLTALNAHTGILYKVANIYCSRPEDRSDLIQDFILEFWRAWPRFEPARAKVSTWMYRIAMKVAINAHRGASRSIRAADALPNPLIDLAAADAELVNGDDDLHALHQLLARFDAIGRSLILLYLEGYSHAEIAEITGLSVSNVATRIQRIKHSLSSDFKGIST